MNFEAIPLWERTWDKDSRTQVITKGHLMKAELVLV